MPSKSHVIVLLSPEWALKQNLFCLDRPWLRLFFGWIRYMWAFTIQIRETWNEMLKSCCFVSCQVSKTVVFPKKRKVSEEARHLILKMLRPENERIDISGIKKHPWYTGKKMSEWLKEGKKNEILVKDISHDSGLGNEAVSVTQEMKEWWAKKSYRRDVCYITENMICFHK